MRVHNPIGSKERFLELFEGVTKAKIKINEGMGEESGVLDQAFNALVNGELEIDQVNNQVNGDESVLEVTGVGRDGNQATFKFNVSSAPTDQDGVTSITDAKLIQFNFQTPGIDGELPEQYDAIAKLNANRKQDILDFVAEYVDTPSAEDTVTDEMFEEAIKFIDKIPYNKGSEQIQTHKAYADQKPTNSELRVDSPELEQYLSELQEYEPEAGEEDPLGMPPEPEFDPNEFPKAPGSDDDGSIGVDPFDQEPELGDEEAASPEEQALYSRAYDNLTAAGVDMPTPDQLDKEVLKLKGHNQPVQKTRAIPKGAEEFWESAEVDRYSNYSQDIDARLRKYAEQTGEDWVEVKRYFKQEADPHNMKSPNEALDIYFKLVDEFLTGEGITEGDSHVVGDVNADDVVKQGYDRLIPNNKKQQIIFIAAEIVDADLGDLKANMPKEQYLEAVRKQALEIYRTDIADLNEDGDKKIGGEYPNQIGKKFKPKNQMPKKKKRPQSVVKISEEEDDNGNQVQGGKADDKDPVDFDSNQIMIGMGVEMEHTDDPKIALEIAMDHLMEIPDYYTRLNKMEKEAGVEEPEGDETEIDTEEKGLGALKPEGVDEMKNGEPDEELTDELLGYKPHNVGDYTNEELDLPQSPEQEKNYWDKEYFQQDQGGDEQNLTEEDGMEEYQGDIGDRYADGDGNQFTVRDKTQGGVTLQGQGGEKEIATRDIQFLKKL